MAAEYERNEPNRHITSQQRHINVDATPWRPIDVDTTFLKGCASAGEGSGNPDCICEGSSELSLVTFARLLLVPN